MEVRLRDLWHSQVPSIYHLQLYLELSRRELIFWNRIMKFDIKPHRHLPPITIEEPSPTREGGITWATTESSAQTRSFLSQSAFFFQGRAELMGRDRSSENDMTKAGGVTVQKSGKRRVRSIKGEVPSITKQSQPAKTQLVGGGGRSAKEKEEEIETGSETKEVPPPLPPRPKSSAQCVDSKDRKDNEEERHDMRNKRKSKDEEVDPFARHHTPYFPRPRSNMDVAIDDKKIMEKTLGLPPVFLLNTLEPNTEISQISQAKEDSEEIGAQSRVKQVYSNPGEGVSLEQDQMPYQPRTISASGKTVQWIEAKRYKASLIEEISRWKHLEHAKPTLNRLLVVSRLDKSNPQTSEAITQAYDRLEKHIRAGKPSGGGNQILVYVDKEIHSLNILRCWFLLDQHVRSGGWPPGYRRSMKTGEGRACAFVESRTSTNLAPRLESPATLASIGQGWI